MARTDQEIALIAQDIAETDDPAGLIDRVVDALKALDIGDRPRLLVALAAQGVPDTFVSSAKDRALEQGISFPSTEKAKRSRRVKIAVGVGLGALAAVGLIRAVR